ncbi:phytanoyl-CoA hydroxylase-interacting protein-like isoform X3 [Ostrea edulis]|uniref:phytanoyl-CoA hydroxylase-interacting protein-like isoform X3 n=1 Tax=Ostrea edulis TaxID=37623 RepID=UPI0024AF772B|nr:phytanoyl-CoA hydroxylase-interacting protein-like isoform X3 [Ostrea edulis]XP_055997094.1 phytanoyl-CoA hydroxylase-interacting protein-like isoform X3 [Ostrea edulis]XP_055997095.1 phytanoyl-CoA hydroxylase-interacting protein-like isoform X3 [Ostrea edulis]XP_055997096.1 phytanoyl-CoA hydroxylase-interacting protein-like isoform X3 [Ostrea edulis]XP_055997097.1 phytanoyl-CoA hydroxylase-interacting protein-like isoform X3 [Ostrea edulis]XP_055997098.1 phytanoyl-CoA hydroxylase-interacti
MADPGNYFTPNELQKLQNKCLKFIRQTDKRFLPIKNMWRDKPIPYWENIMDAELGQMVPYIKDHNGDPKSSINGNIDGLFFSCGLYRKNGRPPWFSFFGNRRLYISSSAIFKRTMRLYFADFYCHYKIHYATLVLTRPNSTQDVFCREHNLSELDIQNNPFLKIQIANGRDEVVVTMGVRVELFYTETVDLNSVIGNEGRFVWVKARGRGRSRPDGIPKNRNCDICN